jgi:hypothetical protein
MEKSPLITAISDLMDGADEFDPNDHTTAEMEAAFRACKLLVDAYKRGEECDGSIEWDEVDDAYNAAREALGVE